MKRLMRAILCGALALALPNPALAELPVSVRGGDATAAQEQVDGRVLHRASGFHFPTALVDMPVRSITIYGPADASVVYATKHKDPNEPLISLYVYPAELSLEAEEKAVVGAIYQTWTASRTNAPSRNLKLPPGSRSSWFNIKKGDIAGVSGYLIARRDGWFMKARFTIPHSSGQVGIERAISALNAADWSWTPEREPPPLPAQPSIEGGDAA